MNAGGNPIVTPKEIRHPAGALGHGAPHRYFVNAGKGIVGSFDMQQASRSTSLKTPVVSCLQGSLIFC
jgi:hypothetical protein